MAGTNQVDDLTRAAVPRASLMRAATYASVGVAGVLVVTKIGAWAATDSVALLSSLVDSLLDVGASVIILLAVRQALVPADREHRFGHGKLESIAGLGQAAFIGGSAVFLLFAAGNRFLHPSPIEHAGLGIGVMALSIVLTLGLVLFQAYVVGRTASVAVAADSLHYKADLLMNVSVIVALLLASELGWNAADPIFAIAIAAYILKCAYDIARSSIDLLMDRELPDEDRARIAEIAQAHDEVHSIHDLRTRSSGTNIFIQFHLVLDPDLRLMRAHEIADEVEERVMTAYPSAEVIIHQDPEGIEEPAPEFQ